MPEFKAFANENFLKNSNLYLMFPFTGPKVTYTEASKLKIEVI